MAEPVEKKGTENDGKDKKNRRVVQGEPDIKP
jgi:hypothetical protein